MATIELIRAETDIIHGDHPIDSNHTDDMASTLNTSESASPPPPPPPPLEPISTAANHYEYRYENHMEHASFPVLPPEINHNQFVAATIQQPMEEMIFECPDCDKTYNSESRLRRHQLYHLDISERPFKCPHCIWSFVQQSELKRHVARKHPEKPAAVIKPAYRVHDFLNLPSAPNPIAMAQESGVEPETDELSHGHHNPAMNTSTSTTSTSVMEEQQAMHEDEDETLGQMMENVDVDSNAQQMNSHHSKELDEELMQIPSPPPVIRMDPDDVDDGEEEEEENDSENADKHATGNTVENETKTPEQKQETETKKTTRKRRRRRFRLRRKKKNVSKEEDETKTKGRKFRSPRLNAKKAAKYDKFFADDFDDGEGYKCKVCGNLFKKKQHLIDHEPIHKKAKPFACKYCLKPFVDKERWQKHQNAHSFID